MPCWLLLQKFFEQKEGVSQVYECLPAILQSCKRADKYNPEPEK